MLNITTVLSSLNQRYQEVLDNVIDPYYFSDEPNDTGVNTNINDGGADMYDDANCLNTNLTQLYADISDGNADNDTVRGNSIPYTHTVTGDVNPETGNDWDNDYTNPPMDGVVASGSPYFGSGSQYFTNMYPDMFVMGATGIDIEEFSITGNIGADGSGSYEVNTFTLTSNGLQFTCFNKQVYDSGDPSINHFIFVPGNGAGIDHLYDDQNEDDDDCLQNLTGIDEIYYLLIAKQPDLYMDSGERLTVAQTFLDIITSGPSIKGQQYLHPEITFRVKTFDPTTLMGQLPPDGNIQNIINQLKNQTVWIPGWPYPLKDGDEFTLYGQAASDLKRKLPQLNVGGTVLEIAPDAVPEIYIFTNSNYVDWVVNPGTNYYHEANNIILELDGNTVKYKTFIRIDQPSWKDIAEKADVIIIPELEKDDLDADLTDSAKTQIRNFVGSGGKLIMFHPLPNLTSLLNNVFDFALVEEGGINTPISLTTEGAELFPDAPATIPSNDATQSIVTTSLPEGAITIYEGDEVNQSVIVKIPYSSGSIYVLGWDWYEAKPLGGQDGGWINVLFEIISA